MNKIFPLISLTLSLISLFSCNEIKHDEKPNVLFIAVDDLRPELNCFGKCDIKSPNIDRLASEGMIFTRSYCNVPVCGASRASLLTGTRPTRKRYLSFNTWIDKENPTVPTLPEYFHENGYYTIGNSKIAHHVGDGEGSWDEEWWPKIEAKRYGDYKLPENQKLEIEYGRGAAYEISDLPDNAYFDGQTTDKAVSDLKRLKEMGKPFFLGIGFLKPHLPFNTPRKYWDLYNHDDIKLPENVYRPGNAPKEAFLNNSGELRKYYGIPREGDFPEEIAKNLIHGYYACVSFTDAQIGRVLKELEDLGLSENTIVVLWGDHGWNLDEHSLWAKECNFETALRAPLIIKVPRKKSVGTNKSIVEHINIYPTLCELCGMQLPTHLEGKSMVELLNNPETVWNKPAVAKWKNGITLIQGNYFYTEWSKSSDSIYASMLYDHSVDPHENNNISERIENKELVKELSQTLHQNWGKDFDK